MTPITLNVLVHGMHAIEIGDHDITLYPPAVPDNVHVYRAGAWKQEQDLSQGAQYHLSGVNAARSRPALTDLSPEHDPVFRRNAVDAGLSFCRIHLPFPDKITPLRLTHAQPGEPFYAGSPAPYQPPSAMPEVVALTYKNVEGRPGLRPLQWSPEAHDGFVNLHIWAMPPGPTPMGHPHQAFQTMARMIGYPDLEMNPAYHTQGLPPLDPHPAVPGVRSEEEKSLHERSMETPTGGDFPPMFSGSFECGALFLY